MTLFPPPRRQSRLRRAWNAWLALPEVLRLAAILAALLFLGSLID